MGHKRTSSLLAFRICLVSCEEPSTLFSQRLNVMLRWSVTSVCRFRVRVGRKETLREMREMSSACCVWLEYITE